MNNRERVLTSLQHKQPDKIPYQIIFTQKAYHKMVEYFGDPGFEANLNNCLYIRRARKEKQVVAPDIVEDEFGVKWDISIDKDIGVVCNRLVTPENLRDYQIPDPYDPTRYKGFEEEIANNKDKFVVVSMGFSLFERAWSLAGMENVLMAMVANPGFVHELLDRILDYHLKLIDYSCQYEIDGILFGDDWGQQRGLLMGPKLWREFIKPRIKQMYQLTKSKGKTVMIHCCGDIVKILPDLIEVGVDVFNPFQPEVMDVFEIKRKYGEALSFYGGISVQKTLPFGTVTEVKAEVSRLLDEIGKNGGYIASPAHAIPGDAKPENIVAMLEVLDNQ
jgi:uroporphyrinogen decarboxylase